MSTMSRQAKSESEYIRVPKQLSKGEEKYIDARKKIIMDCLRGHGILCKKDAVPHIAVLGSGGGERAMIALLGCLDQMAKDNLINSALYLCGVSGSTWCMSAIYKDPDWSKQLPTVENQLIDTLVNGSFDSTKASEWLLEASKFENFSMTDVWAATVVYYYLKEIDRSVLSQQRERDATNPYPIYAVVDKGLRHGSDEEKMECWCELSPHEAGYSHVGAYVDTSVFWCKFENGEMISRNPERDILYLEGLCGSALADVPEIKAKEKLMEMIKRIRGGSAENQVPCDCIGCKMADILLKLHDNPEDGAPLEKLCQLQSEVSREGPLKVFIPQRENWEKMSPVERNQQIANLTVSICDALGCQPSCPLADLIWLIWKMILASINDTWGTEFNFLYNYRKNDFPGPEVLLKDQFRYLEDAGLLLNSPYVAALRHDRRVDLILSFDFAAYLLPYPLSLLGTCDPFETVFQAADYCKKAKIPFPRVDVPEEEKKKPKDFYVFKGENVPTVIHMPLFNVVNCGDKIEEYRSKYATVQLPYDREMIEELLNLSRMNVTKNKKRILQEIQEKSK